MRLLEVALALVLRADDLSECSDLSALVEADDLALAVDVAVAPGVGATCAVALARESAASSRANASLVSGTPPRRMDSADGAGVSEGSAAECGCSFEADEWGMCSSRAEAI